MMTYNGFPYRPVRKWPTKLLVYLPRDKTVVLHL